MSKTSLIYLSITQEEQTTFNKFILDNLLDKTELLEILSKCFHKNLLEMTLEERQEYLKVMVFHNETRNYMLYVYTLKYLLKDMEENMYLFTDIAVSSKYQLEHGRPFKLTDEIVETLNSNDILAFTFAENGACGSSNQIEILTNSHQLFKVDNKEHIQKLIPCLLDMKFIFNSVKNVSEDWKLYNLGLGNHLFVHSSINNHFAEKVKNLSAQDIYKNWYNLIISK